MEYTAVVKRNGGWWIGWIEEVPGVNCQERSHEALRQSLAETLAEAVDFNRREDLAAAGDDYKEENVVISMKRVELWKYLRQQGCDMIRETRRHSWWRNGRDGRRFTISRHGEIDDLLARKLCWVLGWEIGY